MTKNKTEAKPVKATKRSAAALPNKQDMQKFMATLSQEKAEQITLDAQMLTFDAWDAPTPSKRSKLAKEALKISPLCSDAYVILAYNTSTPDEQLELYQKGVDAGELLLKPYFKDDVGFFWGILETRPYMRARACLAEMLWELGRQEEAVSHYQGLLELNPNDNQGARHILATWLLILNRISELKILLNTYEDDSSPHMLYTSALLAFRENNPEAEKIAKEAFKYNKHVPKMLADSSKLVESEDGYVTMGGETEATDYVLDNQTLWEDTPDAIQWLIKVTGT